MPESREKDDHEELLTVIGLSAAQSARVSADEAAVRFAKPQDYTGSRTLYDSGPAKHQAKISLFSSSAEVRDPYTGQILTLTKDETKQLYGPDWQKHLAESDHIHPLERIHTDHKSDAFITNDNIRDAANNPDNIEVTSRQLNNAKRSRTNEEFISDTEYRRCKGITLSEEAERESVHRGREAKAKIDRQLLNDSVKNAASTFHNAGLASAKQSRITALTMSGIMNIVSVIKGEKSPREVVTDTLKAGTAGAATGYVMRRGNSPQRTSSWNSAIRVPGSLREVTVSLSVRR